MKNGKHKATEDENTAVGEKKVVVRITSNTHGEELVKI